MIKLTGNLSERHRKLNQRVKETVSTNVDFDHIKDAVEESDIDKIYKIDVASKYRNVDYIMEVLKSGDAFYISRALKCVWLFRDDEFCNVINTDYLHHNVFPLMSLKMKKKLLSNISQYATDENRAAQFYNYCINVQLNNIAYKFLLYTSESFKMELLSGDLKHINAIVHRDDNYLEHFLNKSFLLADKILEKSYHGSRDSILYKLRCFYSISDIKYLDLVEKYGEQNTHYGRKRFGLRLTKDIVKKHKERVRNMPKLYIKILNQKSLVKHSTAADAKMYLVALLPDNKFWESNYCGTYRYIIDLLPPADKFDFVKGIFKNKYPTETFETNFFFYDSQSYYLMTTEQKEAWALQQVESQLEILGTGNDHRWYKFVNFNRAFAEIKKIILITSDKDKRPDMFKVLVESAKNQDDLEKLLNYFYERHVNEQSYVKTVFIDDVTYQHNVFEFEDSCWGPFDKILYSLKVYSTTDLYSSKTEHKIISLIYHIIKSKDIPEALKLYVDSNLTMYTLKTIAEKLSKEEQNMVYEYLFNFFVEKFNTIIEEKHEEEVKYEVRRYIHNILDLLTWQNKDRNDWPEIVMKHAKMDWDEYRYHTFFKEPEQLLTEDNLISFLKTDANLVVEKLPEVRDRVQKSYRYNLNRLMKKIKVYFSHDNAKIYLDFFVNLLGEAENLSVISKAVHNVFHLADENFKVDFMKKFEPTDSKIDHTSIDEKVLYTQQAICAYARVSRPPVPLKIMLMYVKGDYVRYCLPMFHSYLAHLPLPQCLEFIESILDAPMSLQKHGLRLAFVCFNADNLLKLITSVWKRTKNVSLRRIIFKELHDKILREEEDVQAKLFGTLKTFILDLHQDDEEQLFALVNSNKLPRKFTGDAIEALWATVLKLPEKKATLNRVINVLNRIDDDMNLISEDVLNTIVAENIKSSFMEKQDSKEKFNQEKEEIENIKWELTASYITLTTNKEELNSKLELTKSIFKQYMDKFNEDRNNTFITRRPLMTFIDDLEQKSYRHDVNCYAYVNVIFEAILDLFQKSLPTEVIYMLIWKMKLSIATRRVLIEGKLSIQDVSGLEDKYMVIGDVAENFAKELGVIIRDFIDKRMFYPSFLKSISDKIRGYIATMRSSFMEYFEYKLQSDDMEVVVCKSFLKLQMRELNLVILEILPLKYDSRFVEYYKCVLSELGKLDDQEVRCYLYSKFIDTIRPSDVQKAPIEFDQWMSL